MDLEENSIWKGEIITPVMLQQQHKQENNTKKYTTSCEQMQ